MWVALSMSVVIWPPRAVIRSLIFSLSEAFTESLISTIGRKCFSASTSACSTATHSCRFASFRLGEPKSNLGWRWWRR